MIKPVRPEPKTFMEEPKGFRLSDFINRHSGGDNTLNLLGEKSTSYYETLEAAERIRRLVPDAKLIMAVRNPTDRAISNYFFTRQYGLEPRSLEDVFLRNVPEPAAPKSISVSPFNYLGRGEYSKHLAIYREYFSDDQIHLIKFEELVSNPQHVIECVMRFLNPDTDAQVVLPERPGNSPVNAAVKEAVPTNVRVALQNYYLEEVSKFERMTGLTLTDWKNKYLGESCD